jgi:hypothetical protein
VSQRRAGVGQEIDIYTELSVERGGLLGAVTSRAEPLVLRLASIYALLDHSNTIDVAHLDAAYSLWPYADESAAFVFRDRAGDPVEDKILREIRSAPEGLRRTEIHRIFSGHKGKKDISRVLSRLSGRGLIVAVPESSTGGRPAERYLAVEAAAAGEATKAKKGTTAPENQARRKRSWSTMLSALFSPSRK